ncbi:YciI family protein [Paludibacter jiangxiensis]|uniref:YCII-related domain-containing protein n=1 Tax=Paludibacter jiangxiensis TaxID=681398 RepID=A0A171AHX1_9BACT|nr:YciI family protein [Paludibacter jiangxiensis]GAT63761.1 hypothetical protein PJIAN_4302 [Paludibacter jiangxiensis]
MKEFALIFRMDITTKEAQPTEEQMRGYMEQWMSWINYIDQEGQLVEGGNHFSREGRVLKAGKSIIEGPYIADGNSIAGYILIRATDMDDATRVAEKCPILQGENTSVEIRELGQPG